MKVRGWPKNKYKDHSEAFSAYLLINNYERPNVVTETYVKTWLLNYILYMKPDINFKDQHTNRNFYTLIIRDKQLWENSKISLTSACLKVYDSIDYFFSTDKYDYTSFHYCLVMNLYKVALQILMYCSKVPGFHLPYYVNMEGFHEFHDHPLTFFVWKNTEQGIKEGSKRENVLKLLLNHSDNDVLLVKNKGGISALDFLLQKDHLKQNSSKKKYRTSMIRIISASKLRLKYLWMIWHSKPLKRLSTNLKVLVAQNLA